MNPINYAKGLLDELDSAVRTGATTLERDIRDQLKAVAPEVEKAVGELRGMVEPARVTMPDGQEADNKLVHDLREVWTRVQEALKTAPGSKRTAKAAEPTDKTVPPPAAK